MGQDHPPHEGRRTFCQACIGGMAVVSAGMVTYPVVSFLGRPQSLASNKPLEIPLDKLAVGQAQYAEVQGRQIIVLVMQDGPRVFSASCSHLGCNVMWEAAEAMFRCPCHGAVFNSSGHAVSGPVSAPLESVPFEVKDGKIIVS
jgi:cytochrome b6-f complex iron-sulfur subunit